MPPYPLVSLLLACSLLAACERRAPAAITPAPAKAASNGASPVAPAGRAPTPTRPEAPATGGEGPVAEVPVVTLPPSDSTGVEATAAVLFGTVGVTGTLIGDHGAGIISNNGGAIISNNGANIISNNGGSIISNNGANFISKTKYGVLGLPAGADGTLANALMYLSNRDEKFFRHSGTGEIFASRTGTAGEYRLPIEAGSGFPVGKDVIVNALVDGNLRLSGYIVPIDGANELRINLGTTLATELLRGRAYRAGRTLSSYDREAFYQVASLTQQAIRTGDIEAVKQVTDQVGTTLTVGTFDLRLDRLADLRNQYVAALSAADKGNALLKDLSERWKQLLGERPVAVTTLVGNGKFPRVETYAPASEGDGATADDVPVGTALGVAVSARGDVFFSGLTDPANRSAGPTVGYVRWLRPDGRVSTLWLPRSGYPTPVTGYVLASGYGMAIEKEPSDDVVNNPGMLLVADLSQHRVYRVPIVDRPVLDAQTGKEKWPITVVAGEAFPAAPNTNPALIPHHPTVVDGAANAPNYTAGNPKTSRWRVGDEGDRAYVRGNASHPIGSAVEHAARYAWLNKPVDVKLDELGNIYIADLGNHRVRMVVSAAGEAWLAARGRKTFYDWRQPNDANADGILEPDEFLDAATTPAMKAGRIYTIAGNPRWSTTDTSDNGGYWVGEYADSDGRRAQLAQLDQPAALAFRDGHLYVTDRDNQRIRRVSRDSGMITTFAGSPVGPRNFDAGTRDGDYTPGTGGDGGPATAAQLAYPRGLTFDALGRLYICDTDSGRIRMVGLDGRISTVAGRRRDPAAASSGTDHQTDGDALGWVDLFDHWFLAMDPAGNVVFNDARHLRVRKLWRQWE